MDEEKVQAAHNQACSSLGQSKVGEGELMACVLQMVLERGTPGSSVRALWELRRRCRRSRALRLGAREEQRRAPREAHSRVSLLGGR